MIILLKKKIKSKNFIMYLIFGLVFVSAILLSQLSNSIHVKIFSPLLVVVCFIFLRVLIRLRESSKKPEDLPKSNILSLTHSISIFLGMPALAFNETTNKPPYTLIIFVISEFIQIIYMFTFYKKIVWGRYANPKLRTVTISFIATNIFLGIVSIFQLMYGSFLSLVPLIISYLLIFFATIPLTIYLRKINFLTNTKTWLVSLEDFSFPFYKFTGIIPMFFLLPSILIKSKVYFGISLVLLVIGMAYTGLGEYFDTKRKDELERLIKYEASYFAMQFLPAIFIPLFFIETSWKIQVPWFYVMLLFFLVHALVQAIINRKYE